MKKLSILFMAVMIAAIAGCAGDDSTENNGDLAIVQQLELDDTSTGRTVVLTWSEVTGDIEGYKIYFKANGEGSWAEVGTSSTTTYSETASVAGTYSVMAYDGDNTSEDYSTPASTMPMIFNSTYTIYDQYAPENTYSGFIFYDGGSTYGIEGSAGDPNFHQDIAAYDDDKKGDMTIALYSGDSHYQGGATSYFQVPASGAYGYAEPNGNWTISEAVLSGDAVFFVKMPWPDGSIAYGKLYNLTKAEETSSNNGTSVSFSFEYQPKEFGLTLFTSNAN